MKEKNLSNMFINLNREQIGKKQGFIKAVGPTQIRTYKDCSSMHSGSPCVTLERRDLNLNPNFTPEAISN